MKSKLVNQQPLRKAWFRLQNMFGIFFSSIMILGLHAQTIQVGSGNLIFDFDQFQATDLPPNNQFGYIYYQQIILAEELVNGGIKPASPSKFTAIKMQFPNVGNAGTSYGDWDVWIGHTTKDKFVQASADWEPISNLTQVFSGNIHATPITAGEWFSIPFSTPFDYNGTSNLVVAIHEKTPGHQSDGWSISAYSSRPASNFTQNRGSLLTSTTAPIDPNALPTVAATIDTLFQLQFVTAQPTVIGPDLAACVSCQPVEANFTNISLPPLLLAQFQSIVGDFDYMFYQQIILKEEYQQAGGTAGKISKFKMQFTNIGDDQSVYGDWDVWIGHTDKNVLNINYVWKPLQEMTKIFSGNIHTDAKVVPSSGEWMELEFDQDFEWNGTDNLIIAIHEKTPGYVSTGLGMLTYSAGNNSYTSNRARVHLTNHTVYDKTATPPQYGIDTTDLPTWQQPGFGTMPPRVDTLLQIQLTNDVLCPNAISSANYDLCAENTTVFQANGDAGGQWVSSDATIATVDQNGLVTGVASGEATIKYTRKGCYNELSQKVTVKSNPNAGTISGGADLCVGDSLTLTSNGDANGVWSTSNASFATVDAATGKVKALAAGSVTITYKVTDSECGDATATTSLAVNAPGNAGTISGGSDLCVGDSLTLTSNGTANGLWSTSDATFATVDATSGKVTGVGAGSVTMTYTVSVSGCSDATASTSFEVNAPVNAGIISGGSDLCVGDSLVLTSNGNANGVWSSSNATFATVDASTGKVKGLVAGNVTITYTVSASGCSPAAASTSFAVNVPGNAGTISGGADLCVGKTLTLTSDGDANGLWSTSNASFATVDASSGQVTGVGAGNVTMTYTVSVSGCPNATATTAFEVTVPNYTASDLSISSDNTELTLAIGAVVNYTASINGGTWSVDDTNVATIDPTTGEFTAQSAGTVVVTYSFTNSCGDVLTASDTRTIAAAGSTGINDIESASNVSLFPNPATEQVSLVFTLTQTSSVQIDLIDMNGKVLTTIPVSNAHVGENTLDINVSNYANGIYSLVIRSNDVFTTKKLVIAD